MSIDTDAMELDAEVRAILEAMHAEAEAFDAMVRAMVKEFDAPAVVEAARTASEAFDTEVRELLRAVQEEIDTP